MVVKSRLRFLIEDKNENVKAGHLREVLPADHEPSRHEKHMFLYIDSDLTVAEAQEKFLKPVGIPAELEAEYEQEKQRYIADFDAAVAQGGGIGDIEPFDADLQSRYNSYTTKNKLDLTKIDQTCLQRIKDGRKAIADNREAALVEATRKAQAKYAEHLGRELMQEEKQMKIKDITDLYEVSSATIAASQPIALSTDTGEILIEKAVTGTVAASIVAEKDRKISEIRLAATEGKHEVDYAAFDELIEPDILVHSKEELDLMLK